MALADGWASVVGLNTAEAHAEFDQAWHKIRHRVGEDFLAGCLRRADQQPLALPPDAKRTDPAYVRFLSLCGWMAVECAPIP